MKRKGNITFIVGILLAAVFAIGLPMTALAAETPEAAVPVTIELAGTLPETPEEYQVVLTAEDAEYPMPAGSTGGKYTLTITGAATEELPAISYAHPGVYTYTLEQLPGTNDLATYDETLYTLTVYITNATEGGLEASYVVYADDSEEKVDGVIFTNTYKTAPVDLTVRKVWADNGKNRPTSVSVTLLRGEEVFETVTLDASNDWTYTWTALDGDITWDVKEESVPRGYKDSYKTEDGTVTITNTASLIQTGQLNWPIYLMSSLGLLFVAGGILLMVKKRRNKHTEE